VKEITTTSPEAPAPAAPGPGPSAPAEPAHVDGYSCARAWTALTAAHARIADQLSTALAQGCGLTINGFEILLRLDSAPPPGVRLGELD
jgi:hypothetical protein